MITDYGDVGDYGNPGDHTGPHHTRHVTAVTSLLPSFSLDLPFGGTMSTAVLERIAEQPKKADLVLVSSSPSVAEKTWEDPHPLVPVFIAGAVSLIVSVTFIGSILAWLALRHSGVMAP